MQILIEPTPELDDMRINGTTVPVRIWRGVTQAGAAVEVLVLSVIPNSETDSTVFKTELPDFMVPSRQVYEIDGRQKEPLPPMTADQRARMGEWVRDNIDPDDLPAA